MIVASADKSCSCGTVTRWKVALFVLGLVCLIASAAYFGFRGDRAVEMGLGIAAAVIIMGFAYIDKLSVVKAGTLELHIQRAKEVVEEANATAAQLQELAVATTAVTMRLVGAAGILAPLKDVDKLAIRDNMRKTLERLNVPDEQVGAAVEHLNVYLRAQHVHRIRRALQAEIAKEPENAPTNEYFRQTLPATQALIDLSKPSVAPATAFRALFQSALKFDAVREAIEDLEHFEVHGELRRPAQWQKDVDDRPQRG